MTEKKGIITDIKHFAIHDGDGIRTTVFFKGCTLRCVWCHNPEGLSSMPETAFYAHKCISCGECQREGFTADDCLGKAWILYGRAITVDDLIPELIEDKDFYLSSGGGVTLSGGECLVQANFCSELLERLKEEGINTALDTCGCVPWDSFEKVLPFTDTFLFDLKAVDEKVHKLCTGASNKLIIENLRRLDGLGASIEIRIPFVPGYNDGEIEKMAVLLSSLSSIKCVRVLPYHNLAGSKYEALGMVNTLPDRLPTDGELERAREIIREKADIECL
ncbi:MAG: glycyl-radical enzyme activating protein [Clostridia bacterium]|nr:glycyl-radical enzyme activating protein [Clostridia bacterium]